MKNASISKLSFMKSIYFISFAAVVVSCQPLPAQKSSLPYNFYKPDQTFILPAILREVSGNTMLNQQVLVCVQDEVGKLYFYDLIAKKVSKSVAFAGAGDFEDVALAGNEAWTIKSNGRLYCISSFEDASKMTTKEFKTPLSEANDTEGLCYDPVEDVLLIASKASPSCGNQVFSEDYKAIYKFDLKTKTLVGKPAYLIDLNKIGDFLSTKSPVTSQKKPKHEKKKELKFEPSAIAVHPVTNEVWVMAAKGRAIIVLNRKGDIVAYQPLEKDILPQPEGMAFATDGTLYISSEGGEGSGKLMKFEMGK
jgi:uncharacterized protein YjiK